MGCSAVFRDSIFTRLANKLVILITEIPLHVNVRNDEPVSSRDEFILGNNMHIPYIRILTATTEGYPEPAAINAKVDR